MATDIITSTLKSIQAELKQGREEAKARHDQITARLDVVNSRFENIEKRMEACEQTGDYVHSELEFVKGELNQIRQKELELNLVIKGLPEQQKESPSSLQASILQMLQYLQMDPGITVDAITACRRIGRENIKKPRLVLIAVESSVVKRNILTAKKKKQITADKIITNGARLGSSEQQIYIDEHLTPHTAYIFKKARDLKKQFGSKYVWVKNGLVYIKHAENISPTILHNDLDIEAWTKNFRKRKRDAAADTGDKAADERAMVQPAKYGKITTTTSTVTTRSMQQADK